MDQTRKVCFLSEFISLSPMPWKCVFRSSRFFLAPALASMDAGCQAAHAGCTKTAKIKR